MTQNNYVTVRRETLERLKQHLMDNQSRLVGPRMAVAGMMKNTIRQNDEDLVEICQALSHLPAPIAPPGWRLVPEESTTAMDRAGDVYTWKAFSEGYEADAESIYKAMLAAAPTPGGNE